MVRGGHVGRAATNRIDRESLARCAARAARAAELASTAGAGAHPGLRVDPARGSADGGLHGGSRSRSTRRAGARGPADRVLGRARRRAGGARHLDRRRRGARGERRRPEQRGADHRRLLQGHLHRSVSGSQRLRRAGGPHRGRPGRSRPVRGGGAQGGHGVRCAGAALGLVSGRLRAGSRGVAARHAGKERVQRAGPRRGARRALRPAGPAGGRARRQPGRLSGQPTEPAP